MRTLSFLAASTAVLLVGCAGAKQSASMVLYDADLNGGTGVGEAKSYREEIEVGPKRSECQSKSPGQLKRTIAVA